MEVSRWEFLRRMNGEIELLSVADQSMQGSHYLNHQPTWPSISSPCNTINLTNLTDNKQSKAEAQPRIQCRTEPSKLDVTRREECIQCKMKSSLIPRQIGDRKSPADLRSSVYGPSTITVIYLLSLISRLNPDYLEHR